MTAQLQHGSKLLQSRLSFNQVLLGSESGNGIWQSYFLCVITVEISILNVISAMNRSGRLLALSKRAS